jgi:hypothetical protein
MHPEGKRPLRRPWHRWEDNIRMDVREIGCKGVDWIHMTGPMAGPCKHSNAP